MQPRRTLLLAILTLPLLCTAQEGKTFTAVGQVKRPGRLDLREGLRIADALQMVGLRDTADTTRIIVIRGRQRLKFNYPEFQRNERIEQNVLLENGDTIYVP